MNRLLLVAVTALVTAGFCFGITAISGFGASHMKGEPVYTFVSPFSAARAPDLNLRCEYQDDSWGRFLLCGRYVSTSVPGNVVGTRMLVPFGLVVRMTAGAVQIERYTEQGRTAILDRFKR